VNKQSMLYTVVFTFIVCFAFVFLLSLTNEATRPKVEFNQEVARQQAILSALGVSFSTPQEVEQKYKNVETVKKGNMTLYTTTANGERVYAHQFSGQGLWGTITGVLGVNSDATKTVGLEIISHSETPGLGGRIDEAWFKKQFDGETIKNGTIQFTSGGSGDTNYQDGQVDGITGASRTTDSMRTIINREISNLQAALGGNA